MTRTFDYAQGFTDHAEAVAFLTGLSNWTDRDGNLGNCTQADQEAGITGIWRTGRGWVVGWN